MFVFALSEHKKDKRKLRVLDVLTEREIISLKAFYQVMDESMDQKMFSQEVQRIKQFEQHLYDYVSRHLARHLLKYKHKDYLSLSIYKVKD